MRNHGLPTTFVEIEPNRTWISRWRDGLTGITNTPRRLPHEIGVGRLVNEAVDVSSFVRKHRNSHKFVLNNNGLQAAIRPRIGNPTAGRSLVLIVQYVEVFLRSGLNYDSVNIFVRVEHSMEPIFHSSTQRNNLRYERLHVDTAVANQFDGSFEITW